MSIQHLNAYQNLGPTTPLVDPSLQLRARAEIERRRRLASKPPLWSPNPDHPDGRPNPQRLAYESPADILGYGGAAGSGKSSLLLGLAATRHVRSVIFRRIFSNLYGIIEESKPLLEKEGQYNQSLHRWNMFDGRIIEFESSQYEKDKEKQRGRPRDFYGFDEATEFTESQIRFITAWLRSTIPGQRTRVVLTFNPPPQSGHWIVDFFLPWLAYLFPDYLKHADPAEPGELRWYATIDGKEADCPDGQPFLHKGETVLPLSRTFIPGRLADNPYLSNSNYAATLQALPEPLRSQLLFGDFAARGGVDPFQVVPTQWVRDAQDRWLEREEYVDQRRVPDCIGVDVARGGRDRTVFSPRWGDWIGNPVIYPGAATSDGPVVAELLRQNFSDALLVNVDVIGVGSSAYDSIVPLYSDVVPVSVGSGSTYTDRSGMLRMGNLRAEMLWRLRDALDPSTNPTLALPRGNEVLADLCAARYRVQSGGRVYVESKEDISTRLGRSPDVGDSILLSLYSSEGQGLWSDVRDLNFEDLVASFWR